MSRFEHNPFEVYKIVNIKLARKKAGKTQEEAAQAIGVARTTFGAIEAGIRSIRDDELDALAKWLGLEVKWFWEDRTQIPREVHAHISLSPDELSLVEAYRAGDWMKLVKLLVDKDSPLTR